MGEMTNRPKWLGKEKSTRAKSDKQETKLAKTFGGRKTAGSGSKFSENDVKTPEFEIEAKTTESKQYILKLDDWNKMQKKCSGYKKPLFVLEFAGNNTDIVMMNMSDFIDLTGIKEL